MKRFHAFLLALLLLLSTLSGIPVRAETEDAQTSPLIRVLLRRLNLIDRLDLVISGSYQLEGDGFAFTLPGSSTITCQVREGELYLFDRSLRLKCGRKLHFLRTDENGGLYLNGGSSLYPGDLDLTIVNGSLQAILTLPVETYLQGVLPYEMGDGFPLEALKAQAICARTYALTHIAKDRTWDIVDTTDDQVYRGTGNNPKCHQAVQETAGIVGTYKGKLVTCYYAASNGGQTDLPSHVWAGMEDTVYAITDDPYDLANPNSMVRRATLYKTAKELPDALQEILVSYLAKTLRKQGFDEDVASVRFDSISDLRLEGPSSLTRFMDTLVLTVTYAGRRPIGSVTVTPALDTGTYGEDDDIRLFATPSPVPETPAESPEPEVLGPFESAAEPATLTLPLFPDVLRALKLSIYGANNELITVVESDDRYVLEARRYGHGIGMSQRGAQYMAEHEKWTFDQILKFYYPGMELRAAPSSLPAVPTPDPFLLSTPGPSATPTPRPTIMPVTESLRTMPEGGRLASVEGIDDDSSLNLRSEPSVAGEILMRLYKHQQLVVLETCENEAWVHVRTDSIEGYVMVSFLEFLDVPEASDTSTPKTP